MNKSLHVLRAVVAVHDATMGAGPGVRGLCRVVNLGKRTWGYGCLHAVELLSLLSPTKDTGGRATCGKRGRIARQE